MTEDDEIVLAALTSHVRSLQIRHEALKAHVEKMVKIFELFADEASRLCPYTSREIRRSIALYDDKECAERLGIEAKIDEPTDKGPEFPV